VLILNKEHISVVLNRTFPTLLLRLPTPEKSWFLSLSKQAKS